MNAFENGGKEIRFERFYGVNLPEYIVSILTFAGLIAVYLGRERGRRRGEGENMAAWGMLAPRY